MGRSPANQPQMCHFDRCPQLVDFGGDLPHTTFVQTKRTMMQFQVTDIEFDFDDEFGPYLEEEKQGVINQTMTTIWEADDEDDLIEEITCASGWCIKSVDYVHVLK